MPSFPVLALAGVGVSLICAIAAGRGTIRSWWVPAFFSAAFLAYSLWPILTLGPLGFWPEHVSDLWSVQIFFDLLCSATVAWALLVPRARAVGMGPWPWLALIAATGSIGVLAMLARVLQRESAAT
jgi:uncharacterized membrane protein YhaH (DUF805 family)